jgi:hypothetical protein
MVMVGIERMGCFHFKLMTPRSESFHEDYVAEKLGLGSPSDAVGITNLLNMISQIYSKPEGEQNITK